MPILPLNKRQERRHFHAPQDRTNRSRMSSPRKRLPHRFTKMVQAALFTGCRYGELIKLLATDFNPDTKTLAIRTSKSGKPRHVVLTDEAKEFFTNATINKDGTAPLFTHDDGSLWGKSHQSRPILEACQRAKISPPITFMCFAIRTAAYWQ